MTELEEFLVQNLPLTYHAMFSVVNFEQGARIAGSIAACNAMGQVVSSVEGICCEHSRLFELEQRLMRTRPDIQSFKQEVYDFLEHDADFLPLVSIF